MAIFKHVIRGVSALALTATLGACATGAYQANIPPTANPQEEVAKLGKDLQTAMTKNIDVLDAKNYQKSVEYWEDAKTDLAKGRKQERVLEDVSYGRGYLEHAYSESEGHEAIAPTLFEARQDALKAGAYSQPEVEKQARALDQETAKLSRDLARATTDDIKRLQDGYRIIEARAVIAKQLGQAQSSIRGAVKSGAEKKTPQTLKSAELSLRAGETAVASNVKNPEGFAAAVAKASSDATFLNDVVNTVNKNGGNITEQAAVQIVNQERQIRSPSSTLDTTAAEKTAAEQELQKKNELLASQGATLNAAGEKLAATDQELATKNSELQKQNQALGTAAAQVEIQKAIEKARTQFTEDEAEAYQQGNSLLIRLKNVGFQSGRADLPTTSFGLLSKVSEVAKSLNAGAIKVEGHTDSTGGKKANEVISEKRADAVATYLKSNGFNEIEVDSKGFGFEKPIATNKSKQGRALNRRVDIIITPQAHAAAPAETTAPTEN